MNVNQNEIRGDGNPPIILLSKKKFNFSFPFYTHRICLYNKNLTADSIL